MDGQRREPHPGRALTSGGCLDSGLFVRPASLGRAPPEGGEDEPQQEHTHERGDERDESRGSADGEVDDECRDADRECGDRHEIDLHDASGHPHEFGLAAPTEQRPMHAHGGQREDGGHCGETHEHHVHVPLELVHVLESGSERHGEQEPREDLGAGLHHAQFLQQLLPVAVCALVARLISSVAEVVEFRGWHGSFIGIHAASLAGSLGSCPAACASTEKEIMMTLPPIREWWSELSLEARVDVLGESAPHLSERARAEIRTITGAVVGMTETLSDEDLDYARSETRSEIADEVSD